MKSSVNNNDTRSKESKESNKKDKALKITRCYNCLNVGHMVNECEQPKRKRGSCFKCREMGHVLKDCSKKVEENKVNIDSIAEENTFQKNINY